MSDPRVPAPDQPAFVPPSNPGFAPAPTGAPGGPGAPAPGGSSAPAWPAAGTVPFTPHRGTASGTAVAGLVLSIAGALLGLAIGWGFPLSIVGLVLALRTRRESASSRTLATWSIVLAAVSGLASVAWLAYSLVVLIA